MIPYRSKNRECFAIFWQCHQRKQHPLPSYSDNILKNCSIKATVPIKTKENVIPEIIREVIKGDLGILPVKNQSEKFLFNLVTGYTLRHRSSGPFANGLTRHQPESDTNTYSYAQCRQQYVLLLHHLNIYSHKEFNKYKFNSPKI